MASIVGTPSGGSVPSSTQVSTRGRSAGRASSSRELTVVEHRLHVLPLAHVRELRLGESRIHQHQPGTELSAGGHGDDEAPVVAAEQSDHRATVDAERASDPAPTRWTCRRPAGRSGSRAHRPPRATMGTCGHPGSPGSPAVRKCRVLCGLQRHTQVAEVDDAGFVQSLYSFRLLGDATQRLPNSAQRLGHPV